MWRILASHPHLSGCGHGIIMSSLDLLDALCDTFFPSFCLVSAGIVSTDAACYPALTISTLALLEGGAPAPPRPDVPLTLRGCVHPWISAPQCRGGLKPL